MNRLLLVTDAWSPQVNGVARTMQEMRRHAIQQGIHVRVLHPGRFHTFPCPTEASLRLSSFPYRRMLAHFERFRPDAVHLATEGPLGLSARRICLQKEKGFTTSFCTHFPEYLRERVGIPATWTWKGVHWFHRQASRVFAATKPLQRELERQNFPNVALVPRGVDTSQFHPEAARNIQQAGLPGSLPRPWFLSVGRVAQEKNLEAFLALDLPGSKLIVGDGPERHRLQGKYPQAHFLGPRHGNALAALYAASDVFAFPSLTDTFGLVMLEALASGTPVAAFPHQAPKAVLEGGNCAQMNVDLRKACLHALHMQAENCLAHAQTMTWERVGEMFLRNLDWGSGKSFLPGHPSPDHAA